MTAIRQWLRARKVRRAMPTLIALCEDVPDGYHRAVDRLWLDGGTGKGARACRDLGWAVLSHRGRYVGATAAGRAAYRHRYGELK